MQLLPETQSAGNRTVAIIVNTYDQAHFLTAALESCFWQTVQPSEILAVDDGSHDNPEIVAGLFPGVELHRQVNAGLSAARNAGLARVSSEFVLFLDADDRLTPVAIEAGLECFARNPGSWLVYGAHRVIDAVGRPASLVWHDRLGQEPFLELLRGGNLIAMHATVLYRRDRLRSIGGFDQNLRVCEDYDVYLRIAQRGYIATHDCCVAEYRHHEGNMSRDKQMMLETILSVVHRRAADDGSVEAHTAATAGQKLLKRHYAPEAFAASAKKIIRYGWSWTEAMAMLRAARLAPLALLERLAWRGAKVVVRGLPRSIGWHFGEVLWIPKVGNVRFGDLGRIRPISVEYGLDRGKPIDRYYIERVLQDHSELVRGRVLEVGGRDYTRSFGGEKVVRSDVLDIDPTNPVATIVGDLSVGGVLPDDAFDCIVLTQTLQLLYNLDGAVEGLYRSLAPGGALLITVPGISAIGRDEAEQWCWTFTELSLKTLLSGRFGESNVKIRSYGNVFSAICFLTGLSLGEVEMEKLDYKDNGFPVTVFACVRKPPR